MSVALIGDQPYVYACHIWFDCPPAGRTVRTQRLWRFRGSGLCMDSQSASASRQSKVSTATSAHAADRAGNTVVGSTRRALALRDGRVVLYEPCATGAGNFLPPHRFRLHADIPMLPAAGNIMRSERADRPRTLHCAGSTRRAEPISQLENIKVRDSRPGCSPAPASRPAPERQDDLQARRKQAQIGEPLARAALPVNPLFRTRNKVFTAGSSGFRQCRCPRRLRSPGARWAGSRYSWAVSRS
jgi:hypothetical protein